MVNNAFSRKPSTYICRNLYPLDPSYREKPESKGDFMVHFMDIAREELLKKHDEISVEKLQSLLDLALHTTTAAADPFHED
ncbi:hypothetical protein Godav_019308 [Gossypium davidsonii]|uniref:Uncharacterized protein n=1 Tax=Gossypium davidsonii TaxID=34287 RepID=A0A7J8QZH3_GOSDV|nr:hypothetical protein [Gossypium davidsonii]